MSNTNTSDSKDTKRVIIAEYQGQSRFLLPHGFDAERLVKEGRITIKWDKLYVTNLNGETMTILPHVDAEECIDWKHGAYVDYDQADEQTDEKALEAEKGKPEDNPYYAWTSAEHPCPEKYVSDEQIEEAKEKIILPDDVKRELVEMKAVATEHLSEKDARTRFPALYKYLNKSE